MGLFSLILCMVNLTLFSTVFATKLAFEESFAPVSDDFDTSTAGLMLDNKCVIFPNSTPSQAALTAPQLSCPKTTT